MVTYPIILIAFKEFDNLGMGYLASVLSKAGYQPYIIDIRKGRSFILKIINDLKPLVVGFSVIFQYYIYDFRNLARYLRRAGVSSHFCAGGQYASLRYGELFDLMPSLDSIIRFEGEYSFLELVSCIHMGNDWHKISSLVYKENGRIVVNQMRAPEPDLDRLPYPERSPLKDFVLGKKFATILAGRGCVNNCAFCNNTVYLKQSSFKSKRVRCPEKVAEEMDYLCKNKGCSVFLFEDDDFPLKVHNGSRWIDSFCKALKDKKLLGEIIWKINCRPDDVDYESFSMMKDHGLFHVFLGIDDGTDEGLKYLNKHMTIKESLRGINILKKLDIGINYGFMLFQPPSTFRSVNENLDFLKSLCSDGYTPVIFLKLVPFFDTRTEKDLLNEGRLKGRPGFYDYDFTEKSLNSYYNFVSRSFRYWINNPEGLANVSKWAKNYVSVFSKYYKMNPRLENVKSEIKRITGESSLFLIKTMKELATVFESGDSHGTNHELLDEYRNIIRKKQYHYKCQLRSCVREISRNEEYQRLRQMLGL